MSVNHIKENTTQVMNYIIFNLAVKDTVKDFIRCSWYYSSCHLIITSFYCIALTSTLTIHIIIARFLLYFLMHIQVLMLCRNFGLILITIGFFMNF